MLKIIVASQSAIKVRAVETVMNNLLGTYGSKMGKTELFLKSLKVEFKDQCAQPMDEYGLYVCCQRVEWIIENYEEVNDYDLIISIENYINTVDETDRVIILLHNIKENKERIIVSRGIPLPDSKEGKGSVILEKLRSPEYYHKYGTTKTYGQFCNELYPKVPSDNWMAYLGDEKNRIDRSTFIKEIMQNQTLDILSIMNFVLNSAEATGLAMQEKSEYKTN
ncbi:MAG: hypothetical protein WD512_14575 [Candidatus Paceibacterota bacterium]